MTRRRRPAPTSFVPLFDGHVCSLGWLGIDWIEFYCCHGLGDLAGDPVELDPEMRAHIVECYRLDETTGRRVFDEAVLSRAKGRAKSEIAGFVVVLEGLGECRFAGWSDGTEPYPVPGARESGKYEYGEPMGRLVRSPLIKCLATEEGQAGNTFQNAAFIVEWGKDVHPEMYGGVTGMRNVQSATALYFPGGGEARACTAGSASKDGGKETHVVADETHLYVLPELKAMYATTARNLSKRKLAEPWMHQTSTAYRPGEQSVFEETLTRWRKGELSPRVLVNHLEAKGKIDLDDEEHTMRQLAQAYGDSAGWQDIERKYAERHDTRYYKDTAEWVRFCLNRPQAGDDVWIAKDVVERQVRHELVAPGTDIALGFDGSIRDDATVLIGCRMVDGFLFPIGIWAKPEGIAGNWWQVPRSDVLAAIREAHDRYTVYRGYYDPHEWRSDIESLAAELGESLVVPWETRRDVQMAAALDRLRTDLMQGGEPGADGEQRGRAWHSGDGVFMEHFANAYVRRKGGHILVRKEHEDSARKIDSVPGAALAYEARADVIAAGEWPKKQRRMTFYR